jgi:DNA-binding LytR/AlgR family response regulator
LRERPVIEGGLIAFLIAVPLSIVVVSSNALFLGTKAAGIVDFAVVAGVVFVVSCVITALNYATTPTAPIVVLKTATAASSFEPPSRFMARLPMRLRHARLIALEAEDHYLRVHTDAGSELILMRLGDAVAELDGLEGSRTHRSWWVARAAVTDVVVTAGRVSLTLHGGLSAPVSRSSKAALAQAGWLD